MRPSPPWTGQAALTGPPSPPPATSGSPPAPPPRPRPSPRSARRHHGRVKRHSRHRPRRRPRPPGVPDRLRLRPERHVGRRQGRGRAGGAASALRGGADGLRQRVLQRLRRAGGRGVRPLLRRGSGLPGGGSGVVVRDRATGVGLSVDLCGITLSTPLVPASGTLAKEALGEVGGVYGAILPKTTTPAARGGAVPPARV